MRVMAIDYGDARTGVAVSDSLRSICGTAFTVEERDPGRLALRLAAEARERGVDTLVLGLPKNMDGSEGLRAEKSRAFAVLLERESGISPILWDERRSTVEAHAILHAGGKRMKQHKYLVDAVAAELLLEGYLGQF